MDGVTDADTSGGSLFEEMMEQAVAPLHIDLDGERWTVTAVDSDGVCDLDELDHPADVVEALLGPDIGPDVLEVLDVLPRSATTELAGRLRGHFHLTDLPGGAWADLVEQIDCYGGDIEADLAEVFSVDLLDFFRGARPWPQLLRQMARLPAGSRYIAAVLDDEEVAARRLEEQEREPRQRRRREQSLVGETTEVAMLREILNGIRAVRWAVVAVQAQKGKAGKPPEPVRGPRTAEDRLKERRALDQARSMMGVLTPRRATAALHDARGPAAAAGSGAAPTPATSASTPAATDHPSGR